MHIHERIKEARKAKKWSMAKLAQLVSEAEGLAKPLTWQTVQQWERPESTGGTAPKRKRLEVVAKLLDLSLPELMGVVHPVLSADAPAANDDEFVQVRRADVRFANGHGSVYLHDTDKPPLSFRADFLRKLGIAPGKAVVVEADGPSNEPKIMDGSVVLVNTGDSARLDGDFFAFRVGDELLIKRLEPLAEISGILATAENPNFKPKTKVYRPGIDDFEVIGRAVWTGALL